ncbi:MAG: hypothetical protein ACJAYC_003620 [Halieaceae bacterium]|jgi:hypothetical protein
MSTFDQFGRPRCLESPLCFGLGSEIEVHPDREPAASLLSGHLKIIIGANAVNVIKPRVQMVL